MTLERGLLATLRSWISDGRQFAVGTLIEVDGSAPLDIGAMMLVDVDGNIEGSVTGGCVEAALVHEAGVVLGGSKPCVHTYGISDEIAGEVGLMCGGTVHIFVDVPDAQSRQVLGELVDMSVGGEPVAAALVVDGERAGTRILVAEGKPPLSAPRGLDLLDRTITREAAGMLELGITGLRRYGTEGAAMGAELRVFVISISKPPRLIIFGATDFTVATASLASHLGFNVTVVDPREPFVRSERFSRDAEVVVSWPDRYLRDQKLRERDVVLVFTHDPKLDEPALIAALDSGAGFIGALGSRRTQATRMARLLEAGVQQTAVDRISAPCGLDIGGRTPAETALSIMAEVVATQNNRLGFLLSSIDGPIHGVGDAD